MKNQHKKLGKMAVVVTASFALMTACSDGSTSGADEAQAGGAEANSQSVLEQLPPMPEHLSDSLVEEYLSTVEADENYTIGVAVPVLQNPTWLGIASAIEDQAEALGVEVRVVDGGGYGDPTNQIAQIEDFMTMGVDGILITPVNNAALEPVIERVMGEGIPVIGMVTPMEGVTSYTGNNQTETGRLACEAIVDAGFEQPNVVMLPGPETAQFLVDRADGFKECAEEHDFNILRELNGGTERADGVSDMEDLIQAFGDEIDVLAVGSNQAGMGAMDVAERSNLDIFVVGAGPASTEEIEAGFGGLVDASYMASGNLALAALIKEIQGESVPEVLEVPQIGLVGDEIEQHDWSWSVHNQ